jgi:GNAT superfamily N-acetyltransferase
VIRRVQPHEAARVFRLMHKVYASHSFLAQGIGAYRRLLRAGQYVSLGYFEGDALLAHAGYQVGPGFVLINGLVVDPATRGSGLGRAVFDARLADIEATQAVDFVVGYSMMQHLGSQRLYSNAFRPIGLEIGYPDIYHEADAGYNRGDASNAEIVLCRRLNTGDLAVTLYLASQHRPFAQAILGRLGVTCVFVESQEPDPTQTGTFLGFHPDIAQGVFIPANLTSTVDFGPLLTSNQERAEFVETIRRQYEGS